MTLPVEKRSLRPEFTGSAREYFRIWIVNLFFSLITAGVYSAWAKVRKKRYFYGSTRLGGDTFDYFGSPKAILKGRITAIAVFLVYALCAELYPFSRFAFWAIAVLAFPWVVVRALTFNARSSVYRGIRFDFSGSVDRAAKMYIGKFLIVVFTLGLAMPWFMARQKAFVLSHHTFGTTRFGCEIPARRFYVIYFIAFLFVAVSAAMGGLITWKIMSANVLPQNWSWLNWLLPIIVIYTGYAVAFAYLQAETVNITWKSTYGPGIEFESSLESMKLIKLYVGNILAVACSAGLLIPWAVVRTLRYRLDNFTIVVDSDFLAAANPALAPVGATGQELGDFFNVDLGI